LGYAPPYSTAAQVQPLLAALRRSVSGEGIGWRVQILIFACVFAAIVTRRPDALFGAEFYAEDGTVWFAQAYDFGVLHALLIPHTGYFQTLPRLTAGLALLVPFSLAPLAMNLVALIVQALPVNVLLSARSAGLATLGLRSAMALAYVALPNVTELNANITNGQWHLALMACLLLVARPPLGKWGRAFDWTVLLISGLTGPFCLLLLPVAGSVWWLRRGPGRFRNLALVTAAALLQLTSLWLTAGATRTGAPLGASVHSLIQLLGGQIYIGALFGRNGFSIAEGSRFLVPAIAAIGGTGMIAYCALRARLEMRLFLVFCALAAISSLRFPMVSFDTGQWDVLKYQSEARYWFLPGLALVWSALWCTQRMNPRLVRAAAFALLLFLPAGIARGWRHTPYSDVGFPVAVQRFDAAPPGTWVHIQAYPGAWWAQLIKRSPVCGLMPTGHVDAPATGRFAGAVDVSGYAFGGQPVNQVLIYIDNELKTAIEPGEPRPDLDGYFPDFPDRKKGFRGKVDLSDLSAGRHEMEVRATIQGGCGATIGTIAFDR
jgi:hypothetical protein